MKFHFPLANQTIAEALKTFDVTWMISRKEVKYKYQRSVLGPFWITISQAVYIGALGFIFGQLFNLRDPDFIPFLCVGVLLWSFATACMQESALSVIVRGQELLDGSGNALAFVFQIIGRNLIIFLHHIVVFLAVAIIYRVTPNWFGLLFVIPAFVLFLINLTWISGCLSLLIPRYRDLDPLVGSMIQLCFFVTPIMWHPSLLEENRFIVNWNPFYHFIEIIRAPLLGDAYPFLSFGIAAGIAIAGLGMYYVLLARVGYRLAYWV